MEEAGVGVLSRDFSKFRKTEPLVCLAHKCVTYIGYVKCASIKGSSIEYVEVLSGIERTLRLPGGNNSQ